jgi:predicted enzyme related to lactoylglutathione lyase
LDEVDRMSAPIVWFEALGQHGDSLHDFYTEVLGWSFDAKPPPPPVRPARRSALRPARWRPVAQAKLDPPWWVTFYARVPDLGVAIAKARSLGSKVLVPPTPHGDTVIAVVSDPEGHPVGLCT